MHKLSLQHRRRFKTNLLNIVVLWVAIPGVLFLQVSAACAQKAAIESVEIGFDNNLQVGFWTPIRVQLSGAGADDRVEVEIPDSDGVGVVYGELPAAAMAKSRMIYGKFGRRRGKIEVRAVNAQGEVLHRHELRLETAVKVHASTRESILCLAPETAGFLELKAVFRRVLERAEDERPLAYHVNSAQALPAQWYGYEGIDRVLLTTSEHGVLDNMDSAQRAALELWVRLGGRLTICLGGRTADVAKLSSMHALLPGEFQELVTQRRAVGIEKFVVHASEPLPAYPLAVFKSYRGVVLASEQSLRGEPRPIVVRYPHGLGMVTAVAVDLDQAPFKSWESQPVVLSGVLDIGNQERGDEGSSRQSLGQITHIGYEDLSGQLRSILDQFEGPAGGSVIIAFSPIAACIVLYILLIAPGDYFLLRRLFGRMEWTWVTFPVLVLLACGAVLWALGRWRSSELLANQIEVVDYDYSTATLRGNSWASVYSPGTKAYSLHVKPAFEFRLKDGGGAAAEGQLLSWMGMPGRGLGGLLADTQGGFFENPYRIDTDANQNTVISELPIAIGSTKQVTSTWWRSQLDGGESNLVRKREFIDGEFSNPFPVEIKEGILFYRDWAYAVQRRILPKQSVSIAELSDPRDIVWRLTRRKVKETRSASSYSTTPWNPISNDTARLVEIMSFFEAAGGRSYTQLSHRYIDQLDLSAHLAHGRAIFIGRADASALQLRRENQALTEKGRKWTFCRVVFPVAEPAADKGASE